VQHSAALRDPIVPPRDRAETTALSLCEPWAAACGGLAVMSTLPLQLLASTL
jgi:hypothetical protein